jgi:hypothetical protein
MTPFSECRSSAYTIRDERDGPGGLRVTYELANRSAACRYPVLVLTHGAAAGPGTGWNVAGYPSLDSAIGGRNDEALGCYLYRD